MSSTENTQHTLGNPADENARIQEQLNRVQHKLLVMSGKGGVGKSSVAVYLSLSLAKLGIESVCSMWISMGQASRVCLV